ncbi:ATP-binding cassette domain-containing protein [Victivallis sp. Marseille-Q1083]|uniref:ABC transporter ATP-binding protein n=1 Tax=Victivallis sp. Marseille-Q1083 TaxID=2717288 RepID=UPI00158F3CF5|nr:ATP-binding cassette domain-containing protein [Victivallis sp. Marseille-Q1083]
MLRLRQLTVARNDQILLQDINLELAPGSKTLIVGPSGSGKSSLLATIAGLLEPAAGEIYVDGIRQTADNLAGLRRQVAIIEQEPVLAAATVREALLLPFRFKANAGRQPDGQRLRQVLEELNLSAQLLNRRCHDLSGGEKQRLAIARVLLLDRRLILADEVTSALDDASCEEVSRCLMRPALTVLAVSHDERLFELFPAIYLAVDRKLVRKDRR